MARETFADRFVRLTAAKEDAELATISGLKYNTIRDIKSGRSKSIKLDAALRLCRALNITPWELQGELEPLTQPAIDDETELPVPFRQALLKLEDRLTAQIEAAVLRASQAPGESPAVADEATRAVPRRKVRSA